MAFKFFCPDCTENHIIWADKSKKPCWEFNGSILKPTFSPSVLITTGCKCPDFKAGDDCWCTLGESQFKCTRCHLYIRDGKIEYLADCTHALAGQVIDLPSLYEN